MIDQNTALFETQTEYLSAYQMNFLRALVNGVCSEFIYAEILQKYQVRLQMLTMLNVLLSKWN